ncbi:MAG: M48 family metallopeptidase [Bacteroidales bacterium]|nr:M48 family metallopeptidase [Bacteroidales bacterium]
MQRRVFVDGVGTVTVCKRRNSRQMRLSLHPEKGLFLSIPFSVSFANAERYIIDNTQVILNFLKKHSISTANQIFTPQSQFTCRKTNLKFEATNNEKCILKAKIDNFTVTILYNQEKVDFSNEIVQKFIKKAISASLQKEAEEVLYPRVKALSEQTGLNFTKVSIGNAQTRWGCCSGSNEIILSCRLLLLPDELIDFVILHELCHITHKDHSKNFHQLLNKLTNGREKEFEKRMKEFSTRLLPNNL